MTTPVTLSENTFSKVRALQTIKVTCYDRRMSTAPTLQTLPLTQIHPDPTQSRTDFDPVALKELADSIKENGLINPISVRRVGDHYEIIAGERRYRAVKSLGQKDIQCFVYVAETSDLETELLSLAPNVPDAPNIHFCHRHANRLP